MKGLLTGMILGALLGVAGFWLFLDSGSSNSAAVSEAESARAEREVLYWVAPMDANYRRDEPGQSPMGMDLVPVYADEAGGSTVTVNPAIVQSLGVKSAAAERAPLWRMMRSAGRIIPDESRISHVHVRTEGWIEELIIDAVGEPVREGQILARVYSPELINAQKEFARANRSGNASLTAAGEEKLRALGMPEAGIARLRAGNEILPTFDLVAPQDGVLLALGVREGMHVTPAATIFSIANLETVWVEAHVFERQVSWVEVGQSAEFTSRQLPGQEFEGTVTLVEPLIDPQSRTVKARIEVANPDGLLRPNQFGEVRIYGGRSAPLVVVPRDAVIRGMGTARVIVARGNGEFEAREVETGIVSGGYVAIERGLEPGEEVVLDGQFLLDSEASASGALRRLESRR